MFESLGISKNMLPSVAGTFHGTLIICGSGRCVWDDLKKVEAQYLDIMAINDMIAYLPFKMRHAFSNDHHTLMYWKRCRRNEYRPLDDKVFLHSSTQTPSIIGWPWPCHGTSALNACYTGLALGYDEIILAGVPMDDSGHFFSPPYEKSNFHNEVPYREDGTMKYWANAKNNVFQGKVKSLSGRTKDLLGEP